MQLYLWANWLNLILMQMLGEYLQILAVPLFEADKPKWGRKLMMGSEWFGRLRDFGNYFSKISPFYNITYWIEFMSVKIHFILFLLRGLWNVMKNTVSKCFVDFILVF